MTDARNRLNWRTTPAVLSGNDVESVKAARVETARFRKAARQARKDASVNPYA